MMKFRFNDGEIEVPDGWEDRSVLALSFPAGVKQADASLAITRDHAAAQHPSLAAYVDRQMVDLAKSCARFELIRREETEVNGVPAQRLEFKWRSPDGSFVRQIQTIILVEGGTALTFTSTTGEAKFAEFAPVFEGIIRGATLKP
jgi:hypothetical protein